MFVLLTSKTYSSSLYLIILTNKLKAIYLIAMDFELFYNLIPKPSLTWTVDDIAVWLKFIGL